MMHTLQNTAKKPKMWLFVLMVVLGIITCFIIGISVFLFLDYRRHAIPTWQGGLDGCSVWEEMTTPEICRELREYDEKPLYYHLQLGEACPEDYYPYPYADNTCQKLLYSVDKPLIYLYPEDTTEVSITFNKPELLITTYPKYVNSWQVLAEPSSNLTDLTTGRSLYGLYWEGKEYPATIRDDGFIVRGEETITFLEEKLQILGLTEREANEFIIYWLPKLESSPYNYIHFSITEEINQYMPLNITPQPDTLIRIIMEYKPLAQPLSVTEQTFITSERRGFTVVEWGGSLIRD